jgi:hypothetical protein
MTQDLQDVLAQGYGQVVSLNALDENGTIVYQGTLIRAKRKR